MMTMKTKTTKMATEDNINDNAQSGDEDTNYNQKLLGRAQNSTKSDIQFPDDDFNELIHRKFQFKW